MCVQRWKTENVAQRNVGKKSVGVLVKVTKKTKEIEKEKVPEGGAGGREGGGEGEEKETMGRRRKL